MDFSNVFETLTRIAMLLTGIFVIYAFIFKRSIFLIFIWHKYLSKDFSADFDKNLEGHIKNKINLEKLNLFFPKFKFKTLTEANLKLDWCVKNKISYDDAGTCAQCLSLTNSYQNPVIFKKPYAFKADFIVSGLFLFISLAILVVLLLLPNISGPSGAIWVKIKQSDVYAEILKDGTFRSLFSEEKWELTQSSCKATPTKPENIPITDSQYNEICTWISDKGQVEEHFKEAIKTLIKVEVSLLPPILFFIFLMYRSIISSLLIVEILKKITPQKTNKKVLS